MMVPNIRYESTNYLTTPFELGVRHLKLAICDGSQETLLHLARERIIYRPYERDNRYASLTIGQRACHIIVGTLEIVGYLTVIVPFITAVVDRLFNKPWYPQGGYSYRTHMMEGGRAGTEDAAWRKNPFDQDGSQDPFYREASWLPTQ